MSIKFDEDAGLSAEHEDQAKLEVVGYLGNIEERQEMAFQAIKRYNQDASLVRLCLRCLNP